MVTKEEIREQVEAALKTVNDPELGIDIWNLGLVYEIAIDENNNVKIDYTLTTMGCPIGPMIEEEVKGVTNDIEGIGELTMEMVMYPPWTPEKMSPLARSALGFV
jgi:metal-sulfur cluster biosynthetic enzyme